MKIGHSFINWQNPLALCLRAGILMAAVGLFLMAFFAPNLPFLLRVGCQVFSFWLLWAGIVFWAAFPRDNGQLNKDYLRR